MNHGYSVLYSAGLCVRAWVPRKCEIRLFGFKSFGLQHPNSPMFYSVIGVFIIRADPVQRLYMIPSREGVQGVPM